MELSTLIIKEPKYAMVVEETSMEVSSSNGCNRR